ncbi:MAG: CPBP family intramembrane metalloprotease [Deltaproteobacteria bacterium]|nr:CPBP family intramembrane metalloprotease [Deltaproteobacteria bacterium]
MSEVQVALLLSLSCVAALAAFGVAPYRDEFAGRVRRGAAALLLIAILAVTVFLPLATFEGGDVLEPDTIWFPMVFAGHLLLVLFLAAWWRLRGDISLRRFLHLLPSNLTAKFAQGAAAGLIGWAAAVTITGAAASALAYGSAAAEPAGLPPIMVWMAELPLLHKLAIICAAMTVEEAFFRGFLQPRVGLILSSLLFACSHFSYGLPFMIVGVLVISIVLGTTFKRTGDLLPCIVAHGVFDAVQLLIVLPLAVKSWTAGLA